MVGKERAGRKGVGRDGWRFGCNARAISGLFGALIVVLYSLCAQVPSDIYITVFFKNKYTKVIQLDNLRVVVLTGILGERGIADSDRSGQGYKQTQPYEHELACLKPSSTSGEPQAVLPGL